MPVLVRPHRDRGGPLPRGRHRGRRAGHGGHLPQHRGEEAGGQRSATLWATGRAPRDVWYLSLAHRARLQ